MHGILGEGADWRILGVSYVTIAKKMKSNVAWRGSVFIDQAPPSQAKAASSIVFAPGEGHFSHPLASQLVQRRRAAHFL